MASFCSSMLGVALSIRFSPPRSTVNVQFLARGRTDNALQIVKSIDLGSIDSDDRVARLETSPLGR